MGKNVVAIGELLWDMLPDGKVLGGAPANFIFRMNYLGNQGKLITRIGNDANGLVARTELKELGLDDELVQVDESLPTGTVNVDLDEEGKPDFHILKNVAYDNIRVTEKVINSVQEADCIYFGSLIQRSEISRESLYQLLSLNPEALNFCDINLRKGCYNEGTIRKSLEYTDILKINDDEVLALAQLLGIGDGELQELAEKIREEFALSILIVTLGAKGAFCITDEDEMLYQHGYPVKVMDTVGSGDAFAAGFMHILLNEGNLEKALKFGNACGALAATKMGATSPISEEQVYDFLKAKEE